MRPGGPPELRITGTDTWFRPFPALLCEDKDRKLFKEEVYARDAMKVIAREGTERVERPEMYKQSQSRCDRVGFKQLPLDPEIVKIVQGFLS
ncbi:hypothetical protein RDI58_021770 [Solanum bulbocastanum]|uniref:Uncharacterized protein n=1 Tax=Solanum bulbocastanum TaxID=147425 RepID=A0AAN8T9D0_SOLBU